MSNATTNPVRRALRGLQRRWALARAAPGRLSPGGPRPQRPPRAVLVVQSGPNASVDYYLKPRLDAYPPERGWATADVRDRPETAALWRERELLIVFCRYASGPWLEAVARRQETSGDIWAVHFADDDLEAMLADHSLPPGLRGRIAGSYALRRAALGRIVAAQWVSTPMLAARCEGAAVVSPLAFERATASPVSAGRRVVYHGTDSHARERAFVMDIASRLAAARPDIRFEIARPTGASAPPASNVDWTPQTAWLAYVQRERQRTAALCLAPLFAGPVNDARAPVKILDADRLGAAGVFAEGPVYSPWVDDPREGLLLPMDAAVWADAIVRLIDDPATRSAMAAAARRRIDARSKAVEPLPWPMTWGRPS